MSEAPLPVEIFCSYAHEDEEWRDKLERHLSMLKLQGLISLWHDRLIVPGTNWAQAIDTHLETASIILLFVSADFFASDYCVGIEMKRALAKQEANEALVIPILVRQVNWRDAPFAHLQALPSDAKPLAAWQDEEMALTDVTFGIRHAVETLPLLAASAPWAALPPIWNVPYPRNPFFLGRESELAQIHQQLHAEQAMALSQPQAISGLGGIGKTQVALEYAYRYHQDYTAVLWARAESTEALLSSFVALATLLRLPEREAKDQEVTVEAVKTWLQAHRRWLLILDNADELALVSNFLPPTLGGHLLLTTQAGATGRLAHRLEIETLEPAPGALFLLRRAALIAPTMELSQVSLQERELAIHISQELGGLPLALDQAGAYLEETGMDLISYWHIYQRHQADLLRKRGGLVADHPAPVATTWSLSFQRVEEKDPAAAELLRVCAYLAPETIPEEILIEGAFFLGPLLSLVTTNALLLNHAIETLRAYSLVRRDPKGKTLSIHRLMQAVLQETLEEPERHIWRKRMILAVNAAFPESEHGTWPQCERLLPQALRATQTIQQYQVISEEAGRLLSKTASYLHDRTRYPEAEALFLHALRAMEQQFGLEHPEVASLLKNLAILYFDQGRYTEAKLHVLKALKIWARQGEREHSNIALSLSVLASIYNTQEMHEQAEKLYVQVLTIQERVLGLKHPQVAFTYNELADFYRRQGKYERAEPLLLRSLHIREQSLGAEHPETAYSLDCLGLLYRDQGKYNESEHNLKRALAVRERQLGPDHHQTSQSLNNLARLYIDQGKYKQAEPLFSRAIDFCERLLSPEHRTTARNLHELANLYSLQGKYEEAEPLFLRSLTIREKVLGSEHPETASSLNDLATLHSNRGKYLLAEPLYHRALAIREQHLGADHPTTAHSLNDLATHYANQRKYVQAKPLFLRALHIREQQLGPKHPRVASSLYGLASLHYNQGEYAQAKLLFLRALQIWEQQFEPEHPDVAEPLSGLANLYRDQGLYEHAEPLYQRALSIREQYYGPEHIKMAPLLNGLAILYCKQGLYEHAESLFRRALLIYQQARETQHPETAEIMHSLAQLREAQNNNMEAGV